MEIFKTKSALSNYLDSQKAENKTIGFVPTMGALHDGHLSLISKALETTDIVVSSIFVNPTQFNDPKDLEKYPRPVEQDIAKLTAAGCDVLFLPSTEEMYAPGETWHIELGETERILEGASRPGHYQGVTQIVNKLFNLVKPDIGFFGQKDFQQVMILRKMVEITSSPVKIVMCPIIRETDGLARSSRNIHLSAEEHAQALALSTTLNTIKDSFSKWSVEEMEAHGTALLTASPGIILDYFEVRTVDTLERTNNKEEALIALVAASVGKTRLIDNMLLND